MTDTRYALPGTEYLSLPTDQQTWLVKPLFPAGGALLLYGDPKVGKSYAAMQLACAVVGGAPSWLGFPIMNSGPVLYVQLDTPRSLWMARIRKLRSAGHPVDDIIYADRETLGAYPFSILDPNHFLRLRECITHYSPLMTIIDTVREAHPADENDSTDMKNVVAELAACCMPSALVLVAHAKKPNIDKGPDLLNDPRGSSYVVGRMDAIVRFTKHSAVYTGREIEEGSMKIDRSDDGFWFPEGNEFDQWLAEIRDNKKYPSVRAKARRLAELTGKKEETCRSYIRKTNALEGVD